MKLKTIRYSIHFDSSPSELYELLMISKKHTAFSGAPCKISTKLGGPFSVYDGYAEGKHLELFKGRKLVQSWRASDWPKGHYSTVTFTFRTPDEGGCTLDFIQEGVPVDQYNAINAGWEDFYWEPMRVYLQSLRDKDKRGREEA